MGEIYRARDTKLQREVALKVLPQPFALDADRRARFQREAQVLASLNHPNIAAIHGLEESDDGQGGREFLFFARGTNEGQGVYVGSLDAPEITRLIAADRPPKALVSRGRSPATFANRFGGQDRWLLYVRQGTVIAQRLDVAKKTLIGEPAPIADSLVLSGGMSASYAPAAFSASQSGLMAYRTGAMQSQLTWFARTGTTLGAFGTSDSMSPFNPEISPDGRQVALRRTVEDNTDIFLMDGTRVVRRTFDAAVEQYPVWSPDGAWLAFSSTRKGGVGDLLPRT